MCNTHRISVLFLAIFYLFTSRRVCASRVFDTDNGVTILALENENIDIQCRTSMPMTDCAIIHPSGQTFLGGVLNNSLCAVQIKATKLDSGEWRCHIGRESTEVKIMQSIQVRVVNQVAAIRPDITAVHGKTVTLECATAKGLIPMSYCRFEPPNGATPFNISSANTADSPIIGRYYYPANKSIDRGDCAVTIRKVEYEDAGLWTCGAGLDDGKEHIDGVMLQIEGLYTMSAALATGITYGVIGIAALLCILGMKVWKSRRLLCTAFKKETQVTEMQEFGPRSRSRSPRDSPHFLRPLPIITIQSPSQRSVTPD